MTLAEKIVELSQTSDFLARWFCLAEIAVDLRVKNGPKPRVWTTKNSDDLCPANNLYSLGCSGVNVDGTLRWVLFDLDVGHGGQAYESTEAAEEAGIALASRLQGHAEVRRSRGGQGVHVCWMPPKVYPGDKGPALAKLIVQKTGIKVCASPLGRQIRWLWCAEEKPNAFKLVYENTGKVYVEAEQGILI
jgi:hypothetical protein